MNEFIDSYSDDIMYLKRGRNALLNNPLEGEVRFLCDASFCRMLAVIMVGSIEMMFQEWQKNDKTGILRLWFANENIRHQKVRNGERVNSLYEAFRHEGIPVDKEVFDDFLAIKYLRNIIMHYNWQDYQKKWVEKRGFPTDTRNFTETHWNRMKNVNDNMMLYISLTGLISKKRVIKQGEIPRRIPQEQIEDKVSVVKETDLPRIFWLNLERISEYLSESIKKVAIEKNLLSTTTEKDIGQMSDDERKILYYASVLNAGKKSPELFGNKYEELAHDTEYSWKEYWRLTINKNALSIDNFKEAKQVLDTLHNNGVYFEGLVPLDYPEETAAKWIKYLLKGYQPLTEVQIAKALKIGEFAYYWMPNISPTIVFNLFLPIVDPKNIHKHLNYGKDALTLMELNLTWKWFVDYKEKPTKNLQFYKDFRNILLEQFSV